MLIVGDADGTIAEVQKFSGIVVVIHGESGVTNGTRVIVLYIVERFLGFIEFHMRRALWQIEVLWERSKVCS